MKKATLIALLLSLSVAATAKTDQLGVWSEDLGTLQEGLYTMPSNKPDGSRINVCWETANAPSQTDKDLVRDQIIKAYETVTRLHFVGWGDCISGDRYTRNIRIGNQDVRPYSAIGTNGLQSDGFGKPSNMVLNFSFKTAKGFTNCGSSGSSFREYCIRTIAAHEFGYAISADHEQHRPDTWPDCTTYLIDNQSDFNIITDRRQITSASPGWDLRSIMNYCNDPCFNVGTQNYGAQYNLKSNNAGVLSSNDLVNIWSIYGASKMDYDAAVPMQNLGAGSSLSFFTPSSAPVGALPDLYAINYGIPTGSNKVEVHAVSGSSYYPSFIVHAATSLNLLAENTTRYGYTMADLDLDGKPDLVYFVTNTATGYQEMHALGGSSNWQNYILHVSLPLPAATNYKFAFGDVDGQPSPDLFSIHAEGAGVVVHVMSGVSNYQNQPAASWVSFPTAVGDVNDCHMITGNFYAHNTSPKSDFICMLMDRTSHSTPIKIVALRSNENYSTARAVMTTQLLNEDGTFADFGIWQKSPQSYAAGQNMSQVYPGDNLAIGYIRRLGSSNIDVHFLNASLYF